jgi:hypothetical protein
LASRCINNLARAVDAREQEGVLDRARLHQIDRAPKQRLQRTGKAEILLQRR